MSQARHTGRETRSYAPYGLSTDPAQLGLDAVTVVGEVGTAVAHHRRTRSSTRAVIFLHGAAGSWTTWTPLLASAQAAGIAIDNPLLIDLPGWGDASLAPGVTTLTIDDVCELVKDCAEELGYTEWDIVGHSMGGFIALHMASIWPQSVLSVGVISGTGTSIIQSLDRPVREFFLLPAFTLLWRAMTTLGRFGTVGAAPIRALQRVGVLRWAVSPLFRHTRRIDDSVINALGSELQPHTFALAANVARGYNAGDNWSRIECSVRALNGDQDVFSRDKDLRHLAAIVSRCVVTVVPDCGHFAAIERPAEVLSVLGYSVPVAS
ncbi:pimeloyl-ACP methyl ester carboxylesterase [Glaciihabitans tibetensis]|uniref:Pimeloyl-ACP methyl ester carboxylesterase n=1 Tax=Glaciihabitans tibetensis TaxID=1266600 RepID=A0A2T0VIX9_9MICO|nr:alpha/beta hydrolase [Glaciihabitans tibetensis]PRY70176.1 pimeloyl-ACP methyl ester carboxylesterase [Glaciihabitans tibetensis]